MAPKWFDHWTTWAGIEEVTFGLNETVVDSRRRKSELKEAAVLTVGIFGEYFVVVGERFALALRVDGLDAELVLLSGFQAGHSALRVAHDLSDLDPLAGLDVLRLDDVAEDRSTAVVERRLPRQTTSVAVDVLDLQRTLRLRRLVCSAQTIIITRRMWANAQRDARPAEFRWHPLFNATKFG